MNTVVLVSDAKTFEPLFATYDGTEGARRILVREGFIKANTKINGYGTVREEFGSDWKDVIEDMDDSEFNDILGGVFEVIEMEIWRY